MTRYKLVVLGLACLAAGHPQASVADHKESIGRTGLPAVVEGKNEVWLESGTVRLAVTGTDLRTTQEFKLRLPGKGLEKKPVRIQVSVREDYARSRDGGLPEVDPDSAKGFKSFAVKVDGKTVSVDREPWEVNEKGDTATRRRTWWIGFQPGQMRRMQIVSVAPLGVRGNRRTVEFVSKDIGRWRDNPNYLEIRFEGPGKIETTLAGIEPKPDNQTRRGARWVYRKATPNRDIFVLLPSTYFGNRRASR